MSYLRVFAGSEQVPSNIQHLSFAPLVKATTPSVVQIYALQVSERQVVNPFLNDPFFQFFFNFDFGIPRQEINRSLGSGVIVKKQGLIVTCFHVVKDGKKIQVKLADQRVYEAHVAATDPINDLAVIKLVNPSHETFPHLEIGDIKTVEEGDLVLAFGNPFGVNQSTVFGIISAKDTRVNGRVLLQTDAAINPGNSGGALVDMKGRLIGIPNAIFSKTGASHGIGFAIPANLIRAVVEAGEKGQEVVRGWDGLTLQELTHEMKEALGFSLSEGVMIQSIHSQSPAREAKLLEGDIILSINNQPIRHIEDHRFLIQSSEVNQRLNLTLWRNGQHYSAAFNLIAPPKSLDSEMVVIKKHPYLKGVKVANLNPSLAIKMDLPENIGGVVVVEIDSSSPARNLDLEPGDMILELNGIKIQNTKDLLQQLKSSSSFSMTVKRGEQIYRMQLRGSFY